MTQNYYQILGVSRYADISEIKKAYKKLAIKFHPDKNNGDKYFEERFKEIQNSYEILTNPTKKGEYDSIYDSFFQNNKQENGGSQTKTSNTNRTKTRKEKEQNENEKTEKNRVSNIKKNAELAFEDKAWIFVANSTIIGSIIGLFMFLKFRAEGYNKKSNQACGVSILGVIIGLILTVIFALGNQ